MLDAIEGFCVVHLSLSGYSELPQRVVAVSGCNEWLQRVGGYRECSPLVVTASGWLQRVVTVSGYGVN